jgi:asparagine synthase (glutamine-hydrolysing)
MCGIAGVILPHHVASPRSVVQEMVASIRHRGPDGSTFLDQGPMALGMCRLSINDLEGGTQPLFNRSKSVAVFYNGEIYNYGSLRAELEANGVEFRTHCDGEVICHLYDRYGAGVFARLDGMFAIALWDRATGQLMLARDIPGEKPLYYHQGSDGLFAFASELAALRSVPGVDLALNEQALWDMPTFLWVPEPDTVYRTIRALPRAHYLTIRAGQVSLHPYLNEFDDNRVDIETATPGEVIAEIRRVVEASVKSRLLSDVPVGSFLSGGLDSSIVATIAAREKGRIDTFSIGFEALSDPYHGSADESEQAAETARHIGSRHHAIHVTAKDFLAHLDTLSGHAGQPYAVSSGLGILSIAEAARAAGIKVLLSGDGADECFGGYSWYAHLGAYASVSAEPLTANGIAAMHNVGIPLATRLASLKPVSTPERAWGWHYYAHETEKHQLFHADFAHVMQSSLRHFEAPVAGEWEPLDYIAQDRNFYFPNEMLSKVDRMTMAHSVEGRVPFAAPQVLKLAGKLKFEHMVSPSGVLKWMLRQAFADVLPVGVLQRPKHGFNVPIDHWLKHEWSFLMDEAFGSDSQLRKRGMLSMGARQVADRMLHDPFRLNGHALFSMIMMNRWLEHEAR